jgi:hypothetical protein
MLLSMGLIALKVSRTSSILYSAWSEHGEIVTELLGVTVEVEAEVTLNVPVTVMTDDIPFPIPESLQVHLSLAI